MNEQVIYIDRPSESSLPAASGRCREGADCAAVDKIEEKREPEDFVGHRKRARAAG